MKYGWRTTLLTVSSIIFVAHEAFCTIKVSEQKKESPNREQFSHVEPKLQFSYTVDPRKPESARALIGMRLVCKHFNALLSSSAILDTVWQIPGPQQRISLHYAAGKGNIAGLRTLIKLGYNADTPERDGATALHYAAKHDKLDAVKILLKEGEANVNSLTKRRTPPLHFAGSAAVACVLLEAKANVHHVDSNGQNALHRAYAGARNSKDVDFKGTFDVIGALALNGCSMKVSDKQGKKPKDYAPAALLAVNKRVYDAYEPQRRELLHAVARLHDMLTPS